MNRRLVAIAPIVLIAALASCSPAGPTQEKVAGSLQAAYADATGGTLPAKTSAKMATAALAGKCGSDTFRDSLASDDFTYAWDTMCAKIFRGDMSKSQLARAKDTEVSPQADPLPTPEPVDNSVAAFGQGFTYTDGIEIAASAPAAFTPGQYAAGATFPHNVILSITIHNGTSEPFDPSLSTSSMSSGGVEGSAIFDTANGLNGSPSTTILPGKSVTWKEAFSVADPSDLTFQVAPDFSHDDSIFSTEG